MFNLHDLIPLLRRLNLAECPPALLSAVGGLLAVVRPDSGPLAEEVRELSSQVIATVLARFRETPSSAPSGEAEETEEEQWLRALYHLVDDEDYQFVSIFDDEEYELLASKRERCRARWDAAVATILTESSWTSEQATDGDEPLWSSLPLAERLHRLYWLYSHTDINVLSRGDDDLARRLYRRAQLCFARCRTELLNNSSFFILHSSFNRPLHYSLNLKDSSFFILHSSFYRVLCSIYPGRRNPAHAALYRQFSDALMTIGSPDDDSTALWQLREIEAHYHCSAMHRADRCILPGLAVIDSAACEAYRLKCYQWWSGLDPDDERTTLDYGEQTAVCLKANAAISAWLRAKRSFGVAIPVEREAEALLTRLASANIVAADGDFSDLILSRSYALLPYLPDGKLRTTLAAHLAWYTDDRPLLRQVAAAVAHWDVTHPTPDDRFVLDILREFHSSEAA